MYAWGSAEVSILPRRCKYHKVGLSSHLELKTIWVIDGTWVAVSVQVRYGAEDGKCNGLLGPMQNFRQLYERVSLGAVSVGTPVWLNFVITISSPPAYRHDATGAIAELPMCFWLVTMRVPEKRRLWRCLLQCFNKNGLPLLVVSHPHEA
jgi:hypothetical protein